jgi:osmotically inducible protein OsmC
MIEKTAIVHWEGAGKKGQGQISTETGALKQYPYGFGSRFEDDRRGTNPEEMLAAAHAACFTMAFSFACDKAGFATQRVDTRASVRLSPQGRPKGEALSAKREGSPTIPQGGGFVIDRIALQLTAAVTGIDEGRFQEIALTAKRECPLSKALAAVAEITLHAKLEAAAA